MKCANSSWETQLNGKLLWAIVLLCLGELGGCTQLTTAQWAHHSKSIAQRAGIAKKLLLWIYVMLYILKGGRLRVILRSRNSNFYVEERWYQDKVVNIILRYLEMERRQDDVKAGLGCLEDIFTACGCYAQGHKCGLLSLSFWLRQEITDHNWSLFERQQDRVGRKAL